MKASKTSTAKSMSMAKGGSGKMSGKNYVGPQVPGQSTSMGQKTNAPAAKGGSTPMASKSGATPAVPGQVSVGGRSGNNSLAPDTGGKSMAGYTGAQNAKPC